MRDRNGGDEVAVKVSPGSRTGKVLLQTVSNQLFNASFIRYVSSKALSYILIFI